MHFSLKFCSFSIDAFCQKKSIIKLVGCPMYMLRLSGFVDPQKIDQKLGQKLGSRGEVKNLVRNLVLEEKLKLGAG